MSIHSTSDLLDQIRILSENVSSLENELEAVYDKFDILSESVVSREQHFRSTTQKYLNMVLSALPVCTEGFESGKGIIRTCDSAGNVISSEGDSSSNAATGTRSRRLSVNQRTSGFFSTSSFPKMTSRCRFTQTIQKAKGVPCVTGTVTFKNKYGPDMPRVSAWVELIGDEVYDSYWQLTDKDMTVSLTGFSYSITAPGGNLAILHGAKLNWIVTREPESDEQVEQVLEQMAQISKKPPKEADAAQQELVKSIKAIIKTNKDFVNARDKSGRTLLQNAVRDEFTDVVKALLDNGADVNAADYLGYTPFLTAISEGKFNLAMLLNEKGADALIEADDGNNAIHLWARWNDASKSSLSLLNILIKCGVSPATMNITGDIPIGIFCDGDPQGAAGNKDFIEALLIADGTVNAVDEAGLLPLHHAILHDNSVCVSALLASGANPDIVTDAKIGTPRECAQRRQNEKVLAAFDGRSRTGSRKDKTGIMSLSGMGSSTSSDLMDSESASKLGSGRVSKLFGKRSTSPGSSGSRGRSPSPAQVEIPRNGFNITVMEAEGLQFVEAKSGMQCKVFCEVLCSGGPRKRTNGFVTSAKSQSQSGQWGSEMKGILMTEDDIKVVVYGSTKTVSCVLLGVGMIKDVEKLALDAKEQVIVKLQPSGTVTMEFERLSPEDISSMIDKKTGSSGLLGLRKRSPSLTLSGRRSESPSIQKSESLVDLQDPASFEFTIDESIIEKFESWYFPEEKWTEKATDGKLGAWCVSPSCLDKGWRIETCYDAATHNEVSEGDFDYMDCISHFTDELKVVPHTTMAAVEENGDPIVCTIENPENSSDRRRILIRTKAEDKRVVLTEPAKNESAVIKALTAQGLFKPKLKWISLTNPDVDKSLESYERLVVVKRHKFGLMYAGKGQTTEAELFNNKEGSPGFDAFCTFIGDKIQLKGFTGYNGGLDTKMDQTGTESVYTTFGNGKNDLQIMFHVMTMLPYVPEDDQKIDRKRHIGNDVCILIYKESSGPEDTVKVDTFLSHFNYNFIIVSPVESPDAPPDSIPTEFRVSVVCKSGVPPFPPHFPENSDNVFKKCPGLRIWILKKLINAERVSMKAPDFSGSLRSTRKQLLQSIINERKK